MGLDIDEADGVSDTLTEAIDRSLANDERRAHIIDLHPFRGLGIPDDIARAAVFLASDDAGWVTGVRLQVVRQECS